MCISLKHSTHQTRHINFVELFKSANESDERETCALTDKRNNSVVIAFDVEHGTVDGNGINTPLCELNVSR